MKGLSRRELIRSGLLGMGVSTSLPTLFQQVSRAQAMQVATDKAKHPERIMVVVELMGGNDGLNTVVPHGHDDYYRARPNLGLQGRDVIKLNDEFGFHSGCTGLESLFKDGKLAVIHGCGYPNPNLSHFTSSNWWHSAVPNGADDRGWIGRFADAHQPDPVENYITNIAKKQSFAVTSEIHSPVVFDDPDRFGRYGNEAQQEVFETFGSAKESDNESLNYVNLVSTTATRGASLVKNACSEYRTMVDYGGGSDLKRSLTKVAAMINAELPTRIFYVSLGGFDTHSAQLATHNILMMYLSDALRGFMEDIARIGRSDDVALMVFTEFGRRVQENQSGGTDHGTAGPMYLLGNNIEGGFHGKHPSLTDLDDGNLKMTMDFRRVYATILHEWMGFADTNEILKGDYAPLGIFA